MRSDALTMTLLYDYYGELLTEKQRGLFDLYYNQDYSLSEIASAAGISRQGVHDTLARAEELLEGYRLHRARPAAGIRTGYDHTERAGACFCSGGCAAGRRDPARRAGNKGVTHGI